MTEEEIADSLTNSEWLRYVATDLVPIWLKPEDREALTQWMSHHERDIANPMAWDDHGVLAGVFEAVLGRKPGI